MRGPRHDPAPAPPRAATGPPRLCSARRRPGAPRRWRAPVPPAPTSRRRAGSCSDPVCSSSRGSSAASSAPADAPAAPHPRLDPGRCPLQDTREQGPHQLLAGGEVVLQIAQPDAGKLGDPAQGEGRVSLLHEQPLRGVEDRLAPLLALTGRAARAHAARFQALRAGTHLELHSAGAQRRERPLWRRAPAPGRRLPGGGSPSSPSARSRARVAPAAVRCAWPRASTSVASRDSRPWETSTRTTALPPWPEPRNRARRRPRKRSPRRRWKRPSPWRTWRASVADSSLKPMRVETVRAPSTRGNVSCSGVSSRTTRRGGPRARAGAPRSAARCGGAVRLPSPRRRRPCGP